MDQHFREKHLLKPRILVAPLDWGLGHATRCIPIIRQLLAQECEVLLAASGSQAVLLNKEFPDLQILPLAGYDIRYSSSKTGLLWQLLKQLPRIIQIIKKEHKWLRETVTSHSIHGIISDNRFGLYHPTVSSIFITHQLRIKSSVYNWGEKWLRKRNYSYINRFSACWVPDHREALNLGGDLSHPGKLPETPVYYTGPLSRFNREEKTEGKKGHLLILLSGPEPQRTILENKIIEEIVHYPGNATIVRGLPGESTVIPSTNMIQFHNHLSATQLNEEMNKAEYVISRSGYSTIMDIATLQKKSILIPTPGQTEQEYLGKLLNEKKLAMVIPQKSFQLHEALRTAAMFSFKRFPENHSQLPEIISKWVSTLS